MTETNKGTWLAILVIVSVLIYLLAPILMPFISAAILAYIADPLVDNPALARSIRNRFPYLDPLHVMQVDLLRRYRAGDHDELIERGIQLTLNTIATGLRNSG